MTIQKHKRNNNQPGREWKGIWIPRQLYLVENLNWTEKILLIEIDSLNGEKGCFASNKYLADFLGVSETTISTSISKLKKLKLIKQESFDGRLRILKADFKKIYRLPLRKLKSTLLENLKGLTINNIVNNKEEYIPLSTSKTKKIKNHRLYENLCNWFLKKRSSITGGRDMNTLWNVDKSLPLGSVIENSVDTLDKLVRLNKFNFQKEITPVIKWVLESENQFWIKNLKSLASLRNAATNGGIKFENIMSAYLQSQPENNKPKVLRKKKGYVNPIQRTPDAAFHYND